MNVSLYKTIGLLGHRLIFNKKECEQNLYVCLENKIIEGYTRIYLGSHGEFDEIALRTCLNLKAIYPHIEILKVTTNITSPNNKNHNKDYEIISFPIEQYHYKQRIIKSNEFMVEKADVVVCYLDEDLINISGAGKAIKYAKKIGKPIINLFNV